MIFKKTVFRQNIVKNTMKNFTSKVIRKWQLILYISLMLSAVTFFVSTAITPKYRSDITILIVQKNTDILTASQNAKYLSSVFNQILYTETFMKGVLETDIAIERRFSRDAKKRKKEWKDEIRAEIVGNTGMLKISVLDPKNEDSYKIALGIAKNFKENSSDYFGQRKEVETRVIDGPITASKVAYPNIILNTAIALIVGVFGSLLIIYFYEDFDLKLIKPSKKGDFFPEDKNIEQQIGDQLARQLEKRSDKASLEYLEKQDAFEVQSKTETQGTKLDSKSETTKLMDELEYIEIPEEEDIVDFKEESIELETIPGKNSTIENKVFEREDLIEIPQEEVGDNNFWENMRVIDKLPLAGKEEKILGDPLLADSMVDMKTYHRIIEAGETFKGFKKLKEKGQIQGIEELETGENVYSKSAYKAREAEIGGKEPEKKAKTSTTKLEKEEFYDSGVIKVKEVKEKNEEDQIKKILAAIDEEALQKEREEADKKDSGAIELTSVGLNKILEKKQAEPQENPVLVEKVNEKTTKDETQRKEQKTELVIKTESLNKDFKDKQVAKPETEKAGKVIDSEEDFEQIAERKKADEKREIEKVLAQEPKGISEDSLEEKKKQPKEIKEIEKEVALEDEIAKIESIDFIGNSDDSQGVDKSLSPQDQQKEEGPVIEESKKDNIFSRLYGKSIFSDKKFEEQKAERTSHHMEMDPEELAMMRKMLQAEGKSEEAFVIENGLDPKQKQDSLESDLKKEAVEAEKKQASESTSPKNHFTNPVKESVKKLETNDMPRKSGRKAQAPDGLPVFMDQENNQDLFVKKLTEEKTLLKSEESKENKDIAEREVDPKKEVSEEEIKEKLNKLLQGDL